MSYLVAIALLAEASAAAAPWHLSGWQARAVVEIAKPAAEGNVDTAAVRIVCQGRGKPDGSDYRVIDAAGKRVPFQLTFHDAARYSLLSFRAAKPKQGNRYYIYFANSQAGRPAELVVGNPKPGSGPPQGNWIPRHGLVYGTIHRPQGENPKTVAELEKLMAGSRAKYGARYQRRVADGYNPFGPSDYYISIYRGWIRIPRAGTYGFCTASNEASFSFLDGKKLVHWPGRHTSERGLHGEKNAAVELTAGLHYLEYYHEEVFLKQVAFLGWSPPGAEKGHFTAIPESIYTAPHQTKVIGYESPKGPQLHFEPVIVDSIWPSERHTGQYTRARFRVGHAARFPKGTTYRWDFGDGQTKNGTEVEHVYLTLGQYNVTLTAQGRGGNTSVKWPLEIYEIQHVTDEIIQGRPPDYAKLAAGYDLAKLEAASLKELAHLFSESGRPDDAIRVGKVFIVRFAGTHPKLVSQVRRLMALAALELGDEGIDQAIADFEASLTPETPVVEKLDSLAQLIRLVGIERRSPEKTKPLLAQVEQTVKQNPLDDEAKAAYRRAVIAAGDVLLWHGKRADAAGFYKRAEVLRGRFIPSQVRAARVGAYPNSIRKYLAARNYGAALELVDRWEETFPTEKVKGQTFYWRGKVLHLRGQHKDAARHLSRAIALAIGAEFETEARWLLATSLEKLGQAKAARTELAKLVAAGINDRFTEMARDKLKRF